MTVKAFRVLTAATIFLRRYPRRHGSQGPRRTVTGKMLVANFFRFNKLSTDDVQDLERISRANRRAG